MDEIHVECPDCGAANSLVAQDVPVRTPIACSACGARLGDLRDFIARLPMAPPPLTSPEHDEGATSE